MGWGKYFDFDRASIKGDPSWSAIARWTGYAPVVVITLTFLCIIQIVVGAVWVASINNAPYVSLSFAAIVQPLVVPGISLFNVIPSLHLHILARSNNPKLALWFSSIIATMFFASAVIFLAACPSGVPSLPSPSSSSSSSSNNPRLQSSFAKTECPAGSNPQAWDALVALQLCSFVGYVLHGVMAWTVIRRTGRQARDVAMGLREMPVVDEEQKRREEEEARRRWRLVRDL